MKLALVIAMALTVSATACRQARDLLPRTHTISTSPDGRWRAWVRQELNLDPPDDHLFLKGPDGRTVRLMDLAPDADWCHSIVWTADSTRVGFLITDNRLSIFDARSLEHVAEVILVKIDGYPGSEEVQQLAFTSDGTAVTFDRAGRWTHQVLSHETLALPTERLQIRPVWRNSGRPSGKTWAKLVARDGREVRVSVKPNADGVATLPAFCEGPFRVVELWAYRTGKTLVLHDVRISNEPILAQFDRP
jgi:hypothetical protein